MTHPPLTEATSAPITRERIADYGDAVGDHNPVHFDVSFAQAAGLPDTVVHGPFTATIVIDQLIAQLGAEALLNLDLRLRGPVFPGDTLSIHPALYGVDVLNQSGTVVATGVTILTGDDDA
ncbi:MAG: MaoC family dehydratase [Acidimicrobiales bacterium]